MTPQHPDALPLSLPRIKLQPFDWSPVVRAFGAMRQAMVAALDELARYFAPLLERMRARANDPVHVAGLEGRYAVRAGLDPTYATPAALDQLVARIMAGDAEHEGDRQLRLLTLESRSLVAAAAIRGWCHSYGHGPAIVAWHRLLGTTAVVVTRG